MYLAALLLFLAVGAVEPIHAQAIHLGVRTGVSMATFGGDVQGLDHRSGPVLGVSVEREVAEHIQVESGVTWIRKGGEGTAEGFEEPIRADHALDYLEIPLAFRASLPAGAALRPTILLGGSVAFEIRCTSDIEPTSTFLHPVDCHPSIQRRLADWSALFGGGVAWDRGRLRILLEGRYHLGLTDLDDSSTDFSVRNRAFSVIAGASVPVWF